MIKPGSFARMVRVFLLQVILLSVANSLVRAQPVPPQSDEITAVFMPEAPRIDGYLDDVGWGLIEPIVNFIQVWPDDGMPASENTQVRIGYDRDNLYFAFRFFDQNPELIRAKNLERGGRNDRDDHAYIGLDTYQDKRNAYLFEMNALGTQDDATITDEGLTLDSFSWDAVYRSETVIDDEGWTLEVSIPFRQLRFPEGEEVEFGLMLSRMINRKNERSVWPRIGLEYGGSSFMALAAVSRYGTLKGLNNIRRGKNIEIKPYIITGAQRSRPDLALEDTESDFTRDLGVDFKYGISSNLTLDLTVNTDFAQVEADNVQLNLTRFNLFFPEKREFFLERSGLFEHGNPRSTQTFFSRRIGLTNQILTGGRLTGDIGRFALGLMNIETGDRLGHAFGPRSTNNTVARLRTNLFPRATAGAIVTNLEQEGRFNRTFGLDAQYRFWSTSGVSAWYSRVTDSNSLLNDAAGHAELNILNDRYGGSIAFTSVGRNYNPALGFVRRRDMRSYEGELVYSPQLQIASLPFIQRLHLSGEYNYIEGQAGDKQSTELEGSARLDFKRRDFLALLYSRQFERLTSSFFIQDNAEIIPGDYTFSQVGLMGQTDSSRRLFATARASTGGFFNGDRTDYFGLIGFRQSRHLSLETTVNHSIINLPIENGSFTATTIALSALGALNRELFAKALIQYDNFSRNIQANIRLDWIHTPGSDLFLVYNTAYHLTGSNEDLFDPRRDVVFSDQVGILKLTYLVML